MEFLLKQQIKQLGMTKMYLNTLSSESIHILSLPQFDQELRGSDAFK